MGNNKDIDIRIIKKYLMTEKDELKLKSFLRLYSNYSKLANFNQNQLENFENEIYTIGNRSLSDKEKIKKEIITIKAAIKKCNDKKVVDYVNDILNDIELIINYDDNVFEGYIPYLKKCICELQSILKLDINFYNTSCELFDNEYENVKNLILNKYKDNYNRR
ncbi:MAG: hypothetical protein ACLT1G_00700 [Bacilli bacterium]